MFTGQVFFKWYHYFQVLTLGVLTMSDFEDIESMIVSVWVFGRDQEVGTSNGVGSSKDASADSDDDDGVNDGI